MSSNFVLGTDASLYLHLSEIHTSEVHVAVRVARAWQVPEADVIDIRELQYAVNENELLPPEVVHGQRAVRGLAHHVHDGGHVHANLYKRTYTFRVRIRIGIKCIRALNYFVVEYGMILCQNFQLLVEFLMNVIAILILFPTV